MDALYPGTRAPCDMRGLPRPRASDYPLASMRELIVCGLAIAMVAGCRRSDAGAGGPEQAASRPSSAASSYPVVVFEPHGLPRAAVTVEIVRTPPEIQRGLMFRRSLPEDHGMLFLMGEERVHSFWMRNTYIPLDMIFIGKDMTVAGVVENATPLTETSRTVDRPSLYVLEVMAGWCAAHGVAAGTPVRFKDVR